MCSISIGSPCLSLVRPACVLSNFKNHDSPNFSRRTGPPVATNKKALTAGALGAAPPGNPPPAPSARLSPIKPRKRRPVKQNIDDDFGRYAVCTLYQIVTNPAFNAKEKTFRRFFLKFFCNYQQLKLAKP